jgi:prepilin-type N-terminal cleavage/methylation domain-containing protein
MKARNRQCGFTLIELLVVVAVIVFGTALVIPALASASNKSQRTICMSLVRQQCAALILFANDNSESLPSNSQGYWGWDMAIYVEKDMTNNGTTEYTWYDPGVEPLFNKADFNNLWSWETPAVGVIGYALTLSGTASYTDNNGLNFSTNVNSKLNATTVTDANGGGTFPIHPVSRPLMACANLNSQGTSTNAALEITYNWTQIVGSFPKDQTSAHLQSPSGGGLPLGGNEGMLDGHVIWVPFSQMKARCGSLSVDEPFFYY